MEPDFSGYVTKYDIECTDGRTIVADAFANQCKHDATRKVPLVYQHNHTDISQVLGFTLLTQKKDGIWGDSYLSESPKAQDAGYAVKHGSLDKYSVWAKDLDERGYGGKLMVHDGVIQETSLVLAGANSGATIYNVLAHSGVDEDDLMIVGGEIVHSDLKHEDKPEGDKPEGDKPEGDKPEGDKPEGDKPADKTQGEVLESLTPEQQLAVNAFIDDFIKEAVTEALTEEPALSHDNLDSSKKGTKMSRNMFDRSSQGEEKPLPQLKHSDVQAVLTMAKGPEGQGGDGATQSLRSLVRSPKGKEMLHADSYGIENYEILFPEAQALMNTPTFVDRRQDWVKKFMAGTTKAPFSRIKTMYADITADEARARGYIKGNQKVEEVFPVFKRTTSATWVYKRQKLDREDIIEITSFDVVAWMKAEMRGKLDEEIARAALFGDGRPTMIGAEMNPDKILDPAGAVDGKGIRSIINDHDLYTGTYSVQLPADPSGADWNILLDTVTESQEFYMGSGHKTAFMTYRQASRLLTIRDDFGHRIYRNLSEVAGDMDVSEIVRVPTELMPTDVLCVVLDLADYTFGTNRGGEVTLFDDFDIDFNQYKYLIEAYLSGALTLPYSAQIFKSVVSTSVELTPATPAIAANVITVPTQTGVVFKRTDTGATLSQGSTLTLDAVTLTQVEIEATPSAGYHFESNIDQLDSNKYKYKA